MSARGALVLACVLAASRAHAQRAPRFELGAGTAAPLSAGVEGSIRVTDWLGVELDVGMLPPPYVDLINATVVAVGGYDDTTASLIEAALDKAIVARGSIVVAPFRIPLAFHAGYSLAALGGGLSASSAIEAVTGREVREETGDEVPISSRVHFLQVGAAWRFSLSRSLVLRVSLEYTQAIASSSSIDATGRTARGQETIDRASAGLNAYLDDVYRSYVKAPVVGVSLRALLR